MPPVMTMANKPSKIAFVVGVFPAVSETWMINQITGLLDRGFDIDIYAFTSQGIDKKYISEKYRNYNLLGRTKYIGMPENRFERAIKALPKIGRLLFISPNTLTRIFDVNRYGKDSLSLKLLFWSEPFVGKKYDLIHLHDGSIANKFLIIKDVVGINTKLITSFYGQDVSKRFLDHPGEDIYMRLKKESSIFIAMSDFMKNRIVTKGFDENKIKVLPIFGIDVNDYPFTERTLKPGEIVQMAAVGRFVEKKGFDDILRALAIVKNRTDKKFMCNIIGGGPLEPKLRTMTKELGLDDVVSYKGYMKIEDIINYFLRIHFYLQPSKTASDGDME
ncbi:MAG: Glycosyl transferase group 1 [Candidatus Yanofskybacteria bacterium GW2011_GWA1_44_21]|uniref:Glycosyl transferase group 1 n=2 Tax=Parcubacteria group TaxID=1794811 RepID=A0A0G0WW88_9BACT|nr:MAG: Glycosyl transferase group 1 [Candidatus Wolfebacteria bacterium GW2011_GWB1_41_12]KKT28947.1 MAG: Glycosyl transferase group 1 [Candidatus Yanofskybacteria bacterium GW2011_GWA2_44_10]KKT50747.1 MAG: Glycosyl transferase group 1 [Candidatus Yanofskybacteria bacterium GW2011_GWA1_44_21]